MDTSALPEKSKNKSVIWFFILLLIAVLGSFLWWWNYRKYITTSDANLDSFRVNVAAQVMAPIQMLYVSEGDTVQKGMLLAELAGVTADCSQIIAPIDGVIARKWVVPGDVVQPGQPVFTINEGKDLWVSVYLDETKFQYIYLHQEAQFVLDAYSALTFYGTIFYIGSNTASQFSLIPPNNASGNYTKVAQRIPLSISIDRVEGDASDKANVKLVSGMSATVKIVKQK